VPAVDDAGRVRAELGYLVEVLVVAGLVWLVRRLWRRPAGLTMTTVGQSPALVPDVADETVAADQLAADQWRRLAQDLPGRGDLRLALRAFYLGRLADLAQRHLIALARHKSNRDYERELDRRARPWPELRQAFAEDVAAFDRIWYGRHGVTSDLLARFQTNLERLKTRCKRTAGFLGCGPCCAWGSGGVWAWRIANCPGRQRMPASS
jgi:hypothetical protein